MTERGVRVASEIAAAFGLATVIALAFLAPHPEPIRVFALVFAGDTLRVSTVALFSDVVDVRLLRRAGLDGHELREARAEVRREAVRVYLVAVFFAASLVSVFEPHDVPPDSAFSVLVGWALVSTLVALRVNSTLDRREREDALREFREEFRRKGRRREGEP